MGVCGYASVTLAPAPRPGTGETGIARELARSFAFGSLAISLVLWLMLGVLAALLMGPKAADS